jgi:DNA gyrase subunit B
VGTDLTSQIASVRKRPGMYTGGVDGTGVLSLVLEIVGNAFDQYLLGRCTTCAVTVGAEGTITVEDDGPGIAVEGGDGLPPLLVWLNRHSNTGTVDGHRPHVHLGVGGFGLFATNALSERFELRSVRAGKEIAIAYERGVLVEPLTEKRSKRPSGTVVRFKPDRTIFIHQRVPREALARRLEDLSFFAPGWSLSWSIQGDAIARSGISARVALTADCDLDQVATHAGHYDTRSGPLDADVALTWRTDQPKWRSDDARPSIASFVNFFRTRDHGAHVDGFEAGLRRCFPGVAKQQLELGLVAVVSVVLADVKFGTPAKDRLASEEAIEPVTDATMRALEVWFARHPDRAAEIRARRTKHKRPKTRG